MTEVKKIIFCAVGLAIAVAACNKKLVKRDYTKVTIQLVADSMELTGRTVFAYDNSFWDERWDSLAVDTNIAREKVISDATGVVVFENVEYTSPVAFRAGESRPQSNFRFVTQYKINDSLVQKVYTVLVTKGNELRTTFKVD